MCALVTGVQTCALPICRFASGAECGAPALSEGKLAAIGLPAWDKAASQMFDIQSQEVMWGGRKLTLETGRIARQADGAVIATYGETVVICAVKIGRASCRERVGQYG